MGETLAASGIAFVVFDYCGTGDSDGDFSDARWEHWVDDGRATIEWTFGRFGGPIILMGLRLGAGLALIAADDGSDRVARFLFWQPVISGAVFLKQLLRLKIAAGLAGGARKDTTKDLRELLIGGECLEIAGYSVVPEMAAAIDNFRIADLRPIKPVDWIELRTDGAALMPASTGVIERWRSSGTQVRETIAQGEPFWAIQETTIVRSLIDCTTQRLIETAR